MKGNPRDLSIRCMFYLALCLEPLQDRSFNVRSMRHAAQALGSTRHPDEVQLPFTPHTPP